MFWGKQVIGEAPGVTATSIQKGLYTVTVKDGGCQGCQACYNTSPMKETFNADGTHEIEI